MQLKSTTTTEHVLVMDDDEFNTLAKIISRVEYLSSLAPSDRAELEHFGIDLNILRQFVSQL